VLGGVYIAKNDPANARASFEKAVALQPTYFAAVSSLAQLDLRDRKTEAAKARFNAVLAKEPKHIGAMSALAELALLEKKPAEATTWLEKASNDNPESVPAALQLGAHYLRIKDNQKALTLARKTQTVNPTHPDVLDLLGQAQMANKDAGALDTYSKLTSVLPKSAMAQYRLAGAYMTQNNPTEAANSLKRAIALQPDFLPAHLAQVDLATRAKQPEQILASARALQSQVANRAVGYAIEADLLSAQGKAVQALPLYEKAFAEKQDPKLLISIHRSMLQSGKEAQADSRLAGWMKTHPDDMTIGMYVAERSLAKGQYKQAAAQFEAAARVAPNNPIVLNNLAWTYQQLKDPRALETAEAAYRISGDSPPVMDTLAMILAERGDYKRGLPLLQKAVGMAPQSGDLRLHLAEVLIKSGNKPAARKELETLLAKVDGAGAAKARSMLEEL
uniref:XrtA/PEP-CTERM system TPR-repeat protein PrsT n=1 Tax=Massilia alkalitolerans TaxID=286638 RepID=UPI0028AB4B18